MTTHAGLGSRGSIPTPTKATNSIRPRSGPYLNDLLRRLPFSTLDQQAAIAAAAKALDTLRNNWLNPPEWTRQEVLEFPGSLTGPWSRYLHDADARGIGT